MSNKVNDQSAPVGSQYKIGLRQVFYATALIASGLSLSPSTIWLSLSILLVWGIIFYCSQRWLVLALLLLGLTVVLALLPTVQVVRESSRRITCFNNMKQITLACLNFESGNGRFPTDRIVILDDGTVLKHSWRIGILPFIEEDVLYNSYNFKEPWNGPNNSKLASPVPYCFACPSCDCETETSYKLVNGPGTAFEEGKKVGAADVNDGTSNTIGLITDHANPTHWMKPAELTAEEAAQAMNSMTREAAVHRRETFFSTTYFGSGFATLDGGTHWWPLQCDSPMQPGAFLINDGYLFDSDVQGQPLVEIKYGAWFRLAIYTLLILLPAFFVGRAKMRAS